MQFRRTDSALVQIGNRLSCGGVTACDRNPWLWCNNGAEPRHWCSSANACGNFTWRYEVRQSESRHHHDRSHAVEQALSGIHHGSWVCDRSATRTQPHPSTAAEWSSRLAILSLQISPAEESARFNSSRAWRLTDFWPRSAFRSRQNARPESQSKDGGGPQRYSSM